MKDGTTGRRHRGMAPQLVFYGAAESRGAAEAEQRAGHLTISCASSSTAGPGVAARYEEQIDTAARDAHCAKIE
jgi:hypothetical protein